SAAPLARPAGAAAAVAASRVRQPTTGTHRVVPTWTPADSLQRGRSSHRRGRYMALAALLVVLGVIGALASGGLGSSTPHPLRSAKVTTHPRTTVAARAQPAHRSKPVTHHKPATPTTTTSTTPAPTPPQSADQLQQAGYQDMLAGNYAQAIPTLRQAVSSATPGSLTYAYALYNLGKSLLMAGNAPAAVSILEQRAKIPNQLPVVMQTLNQALTKSGQPPVGAPSNPAHSNPAHSRSGGAGITAPSHRKPGAGAGAGAGSGAGAQVQRNFTTD
ncbi:MAG: tetratricopeptide repeat protein, partial [Solirubrobacteraceae bacterium]